MCGALGHGGNERGRSAALFAVALAAANATACAGPQPSPPDLPAPPPRPAASVPSFGSASAPATSAKPTADPPPAPDPLPAGFVRVDEEGPVKCGAFEVTVQKESPKAFRRFVTVTGADKKRVYEAHGRRYKELDADLSVDFCGDLTGDGVPELVMTESTMGAHCCYTRYVVSLTSPTKRILFWEKGDAGTEILPVKYGKGKDWQLQDLVVTWPPFDSEKGDPVLSYASAPLVPVIFSLVNGSYQLTSLAYPQVFLQQRDAVRAECDKNPKECWGQIIYWIDSLAIGDWDAAKSWVEDEELRKQLDRRAAAMKKALAAFGTRARPIDPTPKTP